MLQHFDHGRQRNDLDAVLAVQGTDEPCGDMEYPSKHVDSLCGPSSRGRPFLRSHAQGRFGIHAMRWHQRNYGHCRAGLGVQPSALDSSGTSSGASISCYNRWPIPGGIPLSAPNSQWIEFVSATPHNFKASQLFGQNSGTLPTMTCTDGSTVGGWPGSDGCQVWPTGPYTFLMKFTGSTSIGVTLGPSTAYPSAPTSYSLSGSGVTIQNQVSPSGMAHEAAAIATAQVPGSGLHLILPLLCSDSYCYNVAIKMANNFPAGASCMWNLPMSRGTGVLPFSMK